jgi:rfaE bifunctional protein kinase chain/domain
MSSQQLFKGRHVAVFGDAICDRWLTCEPRRLSREAPVMVLSQLGERLGAGGAANVARNLVALGAKVTWIGAVGADPSGREVLRLLEAEGVETSDVKLVPEWTTPTKTRVLASEQRRYPQQVMRIDQEPLTPLPTEVREALAAALAKRSTSFDAVLFSDYEYGALGEEAAAVGRQIAQDGTPAVLDPRREAHRFHGFTAWTPNVGELAQLTGVAEAELSDGRCLSDTARALLEQSECRWMLVTRGNLGMALFGEGLAKDGVMIEASGRGDVTDVCGAGDTAASVFTLGLAAGVEPVQAMTMANVAAGVVVCESGAAVCSPLELEQALALAPAAVRLGARS